MAITEREIRIRFAPPKVDEARTQIKVRLAEAALDLSLLIHELVPGSREESEAIGAVELALSWAHAGVDRRLVTRSDTEPAPMPVPGGTVPVDERRWL